MLLVKIVTVACCRLLIAVLCQLCFRPRLQKTAKRSRLLSLCGEVGAGASMFQVQDAGGIQAIRHLPGTHTALSHVLVRSDRGDGTSSSMFS